jgi:hypothetical protein
MGYTPQTVDGIWPKNVPEGKQVNGFTGELEDAPPNDVSPSPLEQRLAAMGSTAYREDGGDQFTKTGSFGGTTAQVTDDDAQDTGEDDGDGVSIQPTGNDGTASTEG